MGSITPPALTPVNPRRCNRHQLETLTDLPNVGPAMAAALQSLGYQAPADLDGCDAFELYQRLIQQRGCRQERIKKAPPSGRYQAGCRPAPAHSSSSARPMGTSLICLRPSLISNSSPGSRPNWVV